MRTTDTLYQHTAATFYHQAKNDDVTPLPAANEIAQLETSDGITKQALLGVSCYAGGLFSLAWWQLAHPSFLFIVLGATLIIVGAKLFIFPKESFTETQSSCHDYDAMVTMAEYINPHARLAEGDDDPYQHHSMPKCTKKPRGFDFLLPFKLL